MTALKLKRNINKGFTLIELLIVIAIIGVLAVVVLVAINPIEQLARTRDSGRISTVTQVGHAIEAYYTSQNATFPAAASWTTVLTDSGELSTFPSDVAYSAYSITGCTTNASGADGYCYQVSLTDGAIVYARMESNSQNSKCAPDPAWAIFSTADGRGGIVCSAGEPSPQPAGVFVYQ